MKLNLISQVLIVNSLITLTCAKDQLGFVFEMVRHGARTPLKDYMPGSFTVPVGALTASGMRQRAILGKYNRQRYIEKY
jgi:hypothetical protein